MVKQVDREEWSKARLKKELREFPGVADKIKSLEIQIRSNSDRIQQLALKFEGFNEKIKTLEEAMNKAQETLIFLEELFWAEKEPKPK